MTGGRLGLLGVLLFLSLGIFFSQNPFAGWYGLLKFLEFLFFGWYVSRSSVQEKKLIPIAFSFGILFESILAILQYFQQSSLGGLFYYVGERTFSGTTPGIANASLDGQLTLRAYGTFPHPNVLAGFLVIAMTFVILNLIQNLKNRSRVEPGMTVRVVQFFYGTVLLLGTIALLLTFSRAAILVWVVIVITIIAFRKKTWIFAALLVLSILVAVSPLLVSRFSFSLTDESITQRLFLIQASFAMILSHPLFGIGLNNFLPSLPYFTDAASQQFILQPVHNIFLLTASETGVVGFIGMLVFLWMCIKRSDSLLKLMLLGSVVILGMIDHYFLTIQQGQLLLALVLGYCWNRNYELRIKQGVTGVRLEQPRRLFMTNRSWSYRNRAL